MELWESDNEGDTGNSSDSSSEDFAEIMEYFEPQRFKEMSSLEKRAFKAQKQRYDTLRVESEYSYHVKFCIQYKLINTQDTFFFVLIL